MTALMVVANQYGLNPWTREIYAFPDKNNGIVPVVGVDGWARIINDHPQFDGVEFEQNDESCTCIIYRKDRTRPVKVTEWKSECFRSGFGPWQSHPKRMLRHKALIQCARLAFGYGGIYDQDEAERIIEIDGATGEIFNKKSSENLATNVVSEQSKPSEQSLSICSDDDFITIRNSWYQRITEKKRTPEQLIEYLEKSWVLTEKHKQEIEDWGL
jgi:hypothetical protein